MIIVNRNLFSIGGGGSSGKSRGGEDVVDGEVLVEGEETRGEGGTGTCNCNGDRMTDGCDVNSSLEKTHHNLQGRLSLLGMLSTGSFFVEGDNTIGSEHVVISIVNNIVISAVISLVIRRRRRRRHQPRHQHRHQRHHERDTWCRAGLGEGAPCSPKDLLLSLLILPFLQPMCM